MATWARGLAYLWLGETGRVGAVLGSQAAPFKECLDIRLLLTALRFELTLQLRDPKLYSARQCETDLRAVFNDAKELPHASRIGLAYRLGRWHPLVAAYCTVMPNPIPELQFAAEIILDVGATNRVYGTVMPSAYAVELILRCLRLSEKQFVQAPLNKLQIDQRNKLMSTHRNACYRRPVISSIHLIYALYKVGEGRPEYSSAAQTVANDFGIVPTTRASYATDYLALLKDLIGALLRGDSDFGEVEEGLVNAPNLF